MAHSSAIELVLAWHAALNEGNTARLVALSTPDVEVGGPRGSGTGADLLRDWVARARIQLEPIRWESRDSIVVVEQTARWQTADEQLTEPQLAASVFRVTEGRVASVLRFPDFVSALNFAGLGPSPAG